MTNFTLVELEKLLVQAEAERDALKEQLRGLKYSTRSNSKYAQLDHRLEYKYKLITELKADIRKLVEATTTERREGA